MPSAADVARLNAARLAGVRPELRALVERLLAMGAERGWSLLVTEGLRSAARQAELYAKGRTTPGPVVTRARTSRHQTGDAVDLAFVDRGILVWEGPWDDLGALGESLGLVWGGRFRGLRDCPHFELPRPASDTLTP
jgi:peptidoglycan L-alanyl-D-glutamate endopeptidase CwlK